MTLTRSEILKKASEMGMTRCEAARIADTWLGAPSPSKMQSQMAWQSLFINTENEGEECFRSHNILMDRARASDHRIRGNRVSDFSSWVFKLCFPRRRMNKESLQIGKETEERLLQRNRARRFLNLPEPMPQSRHWELVFRDPLKEVNPFKISALKVNGHALFGVPDIVYRNQKTGEVMIVEIKASTAPVPSGGWPNLRAQLWCYAQIDQWRDAPKITLVGQVWAPGATRLRKTLIWDNASMNFQQEARQLFEQYTRPQSIDCGLQGCVH
jgi:hypothetical protein